MATIETVTAEAGNAVASKIAIVAQNGGATVAIFGGLTNVELAAYGGLVIAFIGFVTNTIITWYFKNEHLKLARKNATAVYDE